MTTKILLAKCGSEGNLKEYTQMYYVYFLPKVIEDGKVIYCEKGSLEFVSVSSNGESVVKSYRMIDPAQELLLIEDLIKLWMFHKRDKGELNQFTSGAFINHLIKKSNAIFKDVDRGLYDGGLK